MHEQCLQEKVIWELGLLFRIKRCLDTRYSHEESVVALVVTRCCRLQRRLESSANLSKRNSPARSPPCNQLAASLTRLERAHRDHVAQSVVVVVTCRARKIVVSSRLCCSYCRSVNHKTKRKFIRIQVFLEENNIVLSNKCTSINVVINT